MPSSRVILQTNVIVLLFFLVVLLYCYTVGGGGSVTSAREEQGQGGAGRVCFGPDRRSVPNLVSLLRGRPPHDRPPHGRS